MGGQRTLRLLFGAVAVLVLAAPPLTALEDFGEETGPGPGKGATPAAPTADGWQPISLVTTAPAAATPAPAAPEVPDGPEPANATDRGAHGRGLHRHPVHSRLQHHMKPKRLHRPQDPMSSNKVEVFVAAPPSMLGSFSTLGGPPVRSRTPPHDKHTTSDPEKKTTAPPADKLHAQETRYVLDSRVSFPYELLSPPMALQQRPVQYKNPTEQDAPRKQQAAADEQRQQVLYFGQPHISHGPQSSPYKFIPSPASQGLSSFFDRPQLQVFPQVGLSPFLQGAPLQSPFASAPIYGQPAPELFRKDSSTQAPLYFRGHSPAPQQPTPRPGQPQHIPDFRFVPPITSSALDHLALSQSFVPPAERGKQQGLQAFSPHQGIHQGIHQGTHQGIHQGTHQGIHQGIHPAAHQAAQHAAQHAAHQLTSSSQQAAFQNAYQGAYQAAHQPVHQGGHQGVHQGGHQGVHQGGHQAHMYNSQLQVKPAFHLKEALPTKETYSTKRPQVSSTKQPLIPSQKYPADDFSDQAPYSPAKPSKTTLVNFGVHTEDFGRPKIKLTEGNPIETEAIRERPQHGQYSQPGPVARPSSQPFSEEDPAPQRLSFGKEDAKDFNKYSGVPQRPPEKLRITRPFFQDDERGQHGGQQAGQPGGQPGGQLGGQLGGHLGGHQGLSLANRNVFPTSPNYGPQTFPTPPNFSPFEHRPYVPLFAPTSTPEPALEYLTTPFREETTLPPAHINEVHSPPLRTTASSTRHRFSPPAHEEEEEAVVPEQQLQQPEEKPAFHKRLPLKNRRRKPSSTTTTTTEQPAVQLDRDYPASGTDSPSLEIHELQYQPGNQDGDGHQAAPAPAEVPLTTTPRPSRRKKPSRTSGSSPSDRLRNRLVPPELIKTTTPEPDTTTIYPNVLETTTLPDVNEFRLPLQEQAPQQPQIDSPQSEDQVAKLVEQEYSQLFSQLPSASPTLQDFSSLEDFKMQEPAKNDFRQDEYIKQSFKIPDFNQAGYASQSLNKPDYSKDEINTNDEYKVNYPKTEYPKLDLEANYPKPDAPKRNFLGEQSQAGPSSYSTFESRPQNQFDQLGFEPLSPTFSSQLPLNNVAPTAVDVNSQSNTEVQQPASEEPLTTASPVETTTPTLSSRLRPRIRFNSTRPRFSVKDYHGRKPGKDSGEDTKQEVSSTTAAPSRVRYPSRTRGSHRHTTESNLEVSTESSRLRYRTKDPLRFNSNRYRSTTSTTTTTETPDTVDAGSEVSTERALDVKSPVISRFRPGTGKYYSRYRTSTSTEAPAADNARLEKPSIRVPTRTKGVFSVRRPQVKEQQQEEEDGDNYPPQLLNKDSDAAPKTNNIQRFGGFALPSSATGTDRSDTERTVENEVLPSTTHTADGPAPSATSDTAADRPQPPSTPWTDSAPAASPAASPAPSPAPSQSQPDLSDVQIDTSSEDMMLSPSQRVAELTSSPGNHYNSPGAFKSVMPASRRTPLKVSLSTDDPILPIEAFFNSWSKDQKSS